MPDERLGGNFSIDITNLKAGLQEANRLIRQSEAQFRASAAGMDNWSKSEDGLTKRQQSLNSQISIQKEKISALIREKEKVIAKMKEEGKSQEDIDKAIDGTNRQITKESKSLDRLQRDLDKTNNSLDDLENESKKSGSALQKASEMADNASGKFTVMKGALANLVADGFRTAISAAKEFVTSMVDVGKTFDSAMAQVSAVSGATGEDLETLRAKAKEMGESTKFTATEAADAFNYMAMAGWKTEDMLGGIEGILNLAAAAGSDLATTSDIVTDALTAMGYTAADAGRLADVMAAASSNANTNVEMMGATFQYAAPLVGALGYNMEDTAVAIGLMANAGIKGEKAGTALRSVFTRLASPPKAAAEAMKALGIQLTDADGKMKPFNQVVVDLRKSFSGLSETQQTQYASAIAGQEAMSGLLAIVNAAPSDFDKLTKAVAESDGAAQKMADTMIDNLGGDITVLQSKLEGIKIQVYEKFEPTLRKAIQSVQKWLNKTDWNAFSKKAINAIQGVIKTTVSFGKQALPIAKSTLKVMGGALKFVAENFKTLATVTLTAVTAFKAFSAVMKVTTAITAAKTAIAGLTTGVGLATKAQAIWNATMSANPIGAVITAVGLLAGGIALLVNSQKEATQETEVLNAQQREAVKAAEETANAFRDTKAAADEMAGAEVANIDYTKQLWGELQTLTNENGKVKEGYEGRAQFILNELNNALGTEYTMNGNVIQSYKDIKKSIDDVIQSKKAQILLDAYEETYAEAVKNRNKAELERTDLLRKLSEEQDNYAKKTQEYEEAQAEYAHIMTLGNDAATRSAAERADAAEEAMKKSKSAVGELEKKYQSSEKTVQTYYETIADYEQASTLALQGETDKAITILSTFGDGFKTAASTAKIALEEGKDKQKKILQQQVIDMEINAQLMEEAYNNSVKGVTEEMVKTAKEQANQAKQEFEDVGGNITKGIAKGAGDEEWTLTKAMKGLIDRAVKAAKKAADEHSPSKRFAREVGKYIPQGIAVGVEKNTSYVIKAMNKQVDAMADTLKESAKKGKFSSAADTAIKSFTTKVQKGENKITSAFENTINKVVANAKSADEKHKSDYETFGKNLVDSFSSGVENQTTKAIETTKTAISKIAKTAEEEYNNIQSKISSMQNSLMSYEDIFSFDKGNHGDAYAFTKDIKQQNKALQSYAKDLEKLKKRGVSKELLDYVAGLSTENGMAAATTLKAMTDKELQSFDKQYNKKLKLSKKISQNYYADDLKAVEDNFTDKVNVEVSKLKKKFKKIGKNSVDGFIDGLKSKNSSLEKSLKSFSKSIISQLKKDLKIKSPSRITRDEIGKMLGKGVAVGVDKSTVDVLRSIKGQVKKVQSAYKLDGLSGSIESGINATASGKAESKTPKVTVNQYNTYSQAHSRYELYKSKQQTAAAVRLAMGTV